MVKPAAVALVLLIYPIPVRAQDRVWVAEGTAGYAGFVDDSTKNYWAAGGGVRRYLTPRMSVGPELVVMGNSNLVTDRQLIATGNVTFDLYAGTRRLTPFVVGGLGMLFSRDQVRNGPFWSSDPAFTGGGGMRVSIAERVSLAGEYRLGWGLHHRLTAAAALEW